MLVGIGEAENFDGVCAKEHAYCCLMNIYVTREYSCVDRIGILTMNNYHGLPFQ